MQGLVEELRRREGTGVAVETGGRCRCEAREAELETCGFVRSEWVRSEGGRGGGHEGPCFHGNVTVLSTLLQQFLEEGLGGC